MRRDPDFAIFCGKFEYYEHDEKEGYKAKPGAPKEIVEAIKRYNETKRKREG